MRERYVYKIQNMGKMWRSVLRFACGPRMKDERKCLNCKQMLIQTIQLEWYVCECECEYKLNLKVISHKRKRKIYTSQINPRHFLN